MRTTAERKSLLQNRLRVYSRFDHCRTRWDRVFSGRQLHVAAAPGHVRLGPVVYQPRVLFGNAVWYAAHAVIVDVELLRVKLVNGLNDANVP